MADIEPEADTEDVSTAINVNAGDQFTIKLDANHTTGYSWGLAEPLDPTLLELVNSDYQTNPHPPLMVGVGGQETWTFHALAPGSTTITLIYQRPWEHQAAPADSKSYTVEIIQA